MYTNMYIFHLKVDNFEKNKKKVGKFGFFNS